LYSICYQVDTCSFLIYQQGFQLLLSPCFLLAIPLYLCGRFKKANEASEK